MTRLSRILVTGGAGYLGSILVTLLLETGHRVRVVDNLRFGGQSLLSVWSHPSFDFVRLDIRDRPAVSASLREIDAVVHLAAIVGDPACARLPEEAHEINLQASLDLLEESRRAGVSSFVFASTCSNYGKMPDPDGFVEENSRLAPVSLYAKTKVQFESALLETAGANSMCITPLRLATLYGVSPRMRFDLTLNEFTMKMLTEKRLVVYGERFWRPYVHVRDAARAICAVLEAPERAHGQVYNVGSTAQNFRKCDLVEMIRAHAPDARIEHIERQEDPRDYRVCFAKISRDLGYSTTRTVQAGISEVARFVQSGAIQSFDDPAFRN